jgi:SpoVK/Ycf46/Vps4 family AAA+-type ATPase
MDSSELLPLLIFEPKDDERTFPKSIREDKKKACAFYMAEMSRQQHRKPANLYGGHLLCIYGPEGIGKRELVFSTAKELGIILVWIDADKLLLANGKEMGDILKSLGNKISRTKALPVFVSTRVVKEREKELPEQKTLDMFLYSWLARDNGAAIMLSVEKPEDVFGYRLHTKFIELPMLSVGERVLLWEEMCGDVPFADDVNPPLCANQYIFTPKSFREIIGDASMRAQENADGGEYTVSAADIRAAVSEQSANQLGTLAKELHSNYTWDDLIIDDEERKQLKIICDQVRFRSVVGEKWGFYDKSAYGRGISALFYGTPGTGKTMAAHVLANELGLGLYRVDLSQMVSKYIGETQKNISELFAKAKNTNAMLFFDEADALFSKRTEVKDVRDKHANSDTAHLLQQLEDYEGLVILATNYQQNIDDAFKRRIRFMVQFAFPDEDVRLTLWQTILPKGVPRDEEIDFKFFAKKFELPGSGIKEVLKNASYLAAAEGRGLSNSDIKIALKYYFAKLGKVLGKEDLENG